MILHDLVNRTAYQIAAHGWDDTESAAMVAAFRNLDICIVPGGQPYSLWGNKAGEGIVRLRQMLMYSRHDPWQGLRPCNRQHLRMGMPDYIAAILCAKTTCNDDLAILGQRFANRIQRFLHGAVNESARIDDHKIGILIRRRGLISFGAQLGENLL